MVSEDRLGNYLLLSGLLIAIFLGFETISGASIGIIGAISLDSTYIIALLDAFILFYGLSICSRKMLGNPLKNQVANSIDLFRVRIAILVVFVFSGYLIFTSIQSIPWSRVDWFDPPLNFQLIRNYFSNNLFISLILVLVLSLIFSIKTADAPRSQETN